MAGLYLFGCQGTQPRLDPPGGSREPAYGGVLRLGRPQDPPHLDPTFSSSLEAALIHANTYSRLIRPDGGPGKPFGSTRLVPDLAEIFEQPDETTYVFYLHKGVKFHDKPPVNGRELSSDDVKFTFDRLADKSLDKPNAGLYALLEKIDVPDKYTVKMKIKEPSAPFLTYVSNPYSSWIVPREAVEKFGDLKKNVIGTGPFILESYERNVKAIFKRHLDYFEKGLPYLDGIEYLYIPDQSIRTAALRSGELDLERVSYSEIESVQKSIAGVRIEKEYPGLQTALVMQTLRPPLNDKKIRQAVKYAIDLQKIVDVVFSGEALWGSAVPPVFEEWALSQNELKILWKPDLGKAKQLMAESGLADGFKTTIYTTTAFGPTYVAMAEIVADQLREIKIDVSLQSKDYAAHVKSVQDGTFDMYVGPKTISTDVDEYLYTGYHSKGTRNWSRANDLLLNSLAHKQRMTFRDEERMKLAKDVQLVMADMVYDVPMPSAPYYMAIPPYVQDYQGSIDHGSPVLMHIWFDR